jgi:uncharacterized protein YyaL (SSP411 family)
MIIALVVLSLIRVQDGAARYSAEAGRLTDKTIAAFFDPAQKIWKPPVESAEAVGVQGYTFWPSLLAWQAVIEAAKVEPKLWKPRIATYFDALEQYFDARGHAYCAWKYFPGNDDKFYDDNTWAAVACMEAFEVTGNKRYRARAIDVFEGFVKGGWDDSDRPGGLRWGTKAGLEDRHDRTVSATAAGALSALMIAKTQNRIENDAWAKRALDWIRAKLSAPNGLIYDGFRSPTFSRMNTIWTYNTGVPIRAAVEYARQTGDSTYRDWAVKMGNACIDRTQSPLFDGAVNDPNDKYWYDSTFFVHYLVDGLRALSLATHDGRYLAEARREADYCVKYLKDDDGLYWRNMRLWKIDPSTEESFQRLTRQSAPSLDPDPSERESGSSPVDQRPMVKTLLANASVARMLWLLSH